MHSNLTAKPVAGRSRLPPGLLWPPAPRPPRRARSRLVPVPDWRGYCPVLKTFFRACRGRDWWPDAVRRYRWLRVALHLVAIIRTPCNWRWHWTCIQREFYA
jgi:hypothetical protein